MLAENFFAYAEREAICDGDVRLSYRQLSDQVQAVAASLAAANFKAGEIVVIWAPNSWQWVVTALACWWSGGIVAPISAKLKALDALPILYSTQSRFLFSSASANGTNLPANLAAHLADAGASLTSALPQLQHIVDIDTPADSQSAYSKSWYCFLQQGHCTDSFIEPAKVSPNDTCQILFTSGSTGKPKGVMRGHQQLLRSRWESSLEQEYSCHDRMLLVPAFSHSAGLNSGLLRCVVMGMCHIVVRRFHAQEVLQLIVSEKVTTLTGPPTLITGLLNEESAFGNVFKHLRFVYTAAAYIPPKLVYDLQQRGVAFVGSLYAMTECDVLTFTRREDSPDVVANTVGRPAKGLRIKLVDENGTEVAPGQPGEVWVSGYAVMQGYFKDEVQTRAALSEDGWLRTGDMGRFTDAGNLQIVGRKKDMLIVHGYNVYPTEVEAQLMASGLVENAAVVGQSSKFSGEACVAFVVAKQGMNVTPIELLAWARKNMADFKAPQKFIFCDSLPLNVNGKIDKLQLKQLLLDSPRLNHISKPGTGTH